MYLFPALGQCAGGSQICIEVEPCSVGFTCIDFTCCPYAPPPGPCSSPDGTCKGNGQCQDGFTCKESVCCPIGEMDSAKMALLAKSQSPVRMEHAKETDSAKMALLAKSRSPVL
ncbi:hypothetical protein DPMN_122878 [Dreissena polymorpha]|uniref:Uncharacterized protein n=1 Tax=Dreissena polymorpha TaxID=45954 RepID=A0A9D4JUK8_DREPO|nr:hypothetical protein DPMN_122878 [Dreissena polymorpha]